jgi:drug/metabolite transporter (DMT)-like permease
MQRNLAGQGAMAGQDWALLAGLALVFGSAFFLQKLALASYGPLSAALGRVALGALMLCCLAALRGRRLPGRPGIYLCLLVMGALNNAIPFSLICWGQTHIDSGLAAVLNATTPIFTVLAAHAAGQERLTPRRVAGVGLGFLGVAVLIGPASLTRLDPANLGAIAVLAAAASYAAAGIWGRRLSELPIEVAAGGMLTGSTLLLLPLALVLEHPWRVAPTTESLAAIAALGCLSTAVAYLIYFRVLRRAGPTNLLLVTFLLPVVALALGSTFLGERLEVRDLAGLFLILGGLAAIDGRPMALARRAFKASSPRAAATSISPRDSRPS